MRDFLHLCLAMVLVFGFCVALLADAKTDLRIKKETDDKDYTIYKLVNAGQRAVHAKIQMEKRCSGLSNNKKPSVNELWVSAGSTVELARVWPRSTCRRTYRVLEASYE